MLLKSQFGQAKALAVTEKADARPGIPFYVKKGRLIQETSYLETLATCTLTAKKVTHGADGKPAQVEIEYAHAKTISLSPENISSLAAIRTKLADVQRAGELGPRWEKLKADFDALAVFIGQLPAHTLPLESNVIHETNFVDYDTPFYLNKLQPISGSAELSLELAADGTLTKAAVKAEEKAFEQVLDLLPTDKLLEQAKAGAATEQAAKTADAVTGVVSYEFNLVVEQRYVRHIRFADVADRSFRLGLPLSDDRHWYRREIVADLSPAGKPAEAAPAASDRPKQG
ncbi:MAG: hypothetical protein IPM07_22945 [Anaerolineales bacterium]|nr:hypothetical protein [Anaerolineales bacterium]